MRLFNLQLNGEEPPSQTEGRRLRAAFITSLRDVGGCDQNGRNIEIAGQQRYMRGLIEAVVDGINAGDPIADHMEIVGVAYDDGVRELERMGYPVQPETGRPWIYPADRRVEPGGARLGEITRHIPSRFRRLPMRDEIGRREEKAEFEERVADFASEVGADVLISDHLMLQIEDLIDQNRWGMLGRVLNIHPAMTHGDYPFALRGPTPTQDAIDRANGFRRTDNNGGRELVEPYCLTGATCHFVDRIIDDGAVICDNECTPVYPDDDANPQALRYRNYGMAKIPVFMEGFMHYNRTMFDRVVRGYTPLITQPQHDSTYRTSPERVAVSAFR